jgi:hypothetical protein
MQLVLRFVGFVESTIAFLPPWRHRTFVLRGDGPGRRPSCLRPWSDALLALKHSRGRRDACPALQKTGNCLPNCRFVNSI